MIRHEILGIWRVALAPDTEAALGPKAIKALDQALKTRAAVSVVQCDGYVFNLTLLPRELIEQEAARRGRAASPKESE